MHGDNEPPRVNILTYCQIYLQSH